MGDSAKTIIPILGVGALAAMTGGAALGALGPAAAGAAGAGAGLGGAEGALLAPGLIGAEEAFPGASTMLGGSGVAGNVGSNAGFLSNIFPKGKSTAENALLAGQLGGMVGNLFGAGQEPLKAPAPFLPNIGGGGGAGKPTADSAMAALVQARAARAGGGRRLF